MNKKIWLGMLIIAFVAGGAFAIDFNLSAGVGGFIGGDFGGGFETTLKYMSQSLTQTVELPFFGGGVYGFVDATFVELTFGFFSGNGTMKATTKMGNTSQVSEEDFNISSFNIGLLAKYPFEINDKLLFFPLLGVDYQNVLSVKADGEEYTNADGNKAPGDWSVLWFKAGAGMDFLFTNSIYLRLEALYGIRLTSKVEKDTVKMLSKEELPGVEVESIILIGNGLTAKLAIGFRF
jgi:opacity protein-like surface antigen